MLRCDLLICICIISIIRITNTHLRFFSCFQSLPGIPSGTGTTPALINGSVTLTPSLFALASTHGGFAVVPTVAVALQPTVKRPVAATIVNNSFLFMSKIFYTLPA